MIRDILRVTLLFYGLACGVVKGQLDWDGNQISDLWQRLYDEAVLDGVTDSDSDGFTDFEEGCAGTNPLDGANYFYADLKGSDDSLGLEYSTVGGKWYVLEVFQEPGVWEARGEPRLGTGSVEFWDLEGRSSGIVRMKVFDRDSDQDGLKSWEEFAFGYSDEDRYSSQLGGGITDFAAAHIRLEGTGNEILAGGQIVERRQASKAEVVRFLNQSTWGPTTELVSEVQEMGMGAWLHHQLTAEPNLLTPVSGNGPLTLGSYPYYTTMGIVRAAMNHKDQVSQRMANALSEIVVVSTASDTLRQNFPAQRKYYDILKKNSLGNYRELLDEITYNPAMGIYLTYVQNQKSDPSIGRLPDENYAREIMQLFTIGLVKLNQDGSSKLDTEGQPIPTYSNNEIMELAKVFTGFGFGGPRVVQFFSVPPGTDYHYPMIMYDDFHEQGPKVLVDGTIIPEGQTGEEDVDMALDILTNHQNVGPFVGRLLIQRLVTSNPSPGYIERVAGVWADDGTGQRGNLQAVARAILMDPEARNDQSGNDSFGRMRGPFERFVALMRAFDAKNERAASTTKPTYPIQLVFLPETFVQVPLWSDSVFNFYLPDHQPLGEIRDRGLTGPEYEILTDSTLIQTDNLFRRMVDTGVDVVSTNPADRVYFDFSEALALISDSDALVDHIDLRLTGGIMAESTKNAIRLMLANETNRDPEYLVKAAVHLGATSPDFVILK